MATEVIESSQAGQESGGDAAQAAGSRSKLVSRLLMPADSLPQFVTDLVTAQAVTVAGTEAAGFLIERAAEGGSEFLLRPIAHVRPGDANAETRTAAINAFQGLIKPCVDQGKDGTIEVSGPADGNIEPQYCLVTLLRNEGNVVAVSAVITRCMNLERAKQRLISMQLVAGYFELYNLRRGADQARMIAQSHQHVLQLATAVATAEGFDSAAMNLCNELATRSGASRVSLGWLKGRTVKVAALSHTEQFDKKQELIVQLQRAMEECLDQEEVVEFDPQGKGTTQNVSRAAAELSRAQGGNIVLSLPLRKTGEIVGVVTLEFAPHRPLGPNVATGLAVAVDLLAPQLFDRYENDRWLITKAGLSARGLAEKAGGKQHWVAKSVIIGVILVGLFISPLSLYKPMYHVSAPFQFDPTQKYSLTVPFEGKLDEVYVKPASLVAKGQPLFKLDTTELELKRRDALSQARAKELEAQKDEAAAQQDRTKYADAQIARQEREEYQAQADLAQYQITEATVVSPCNGEILKGDLNDKINTVLRKEDVQVEVGPRDQLRLKLAVNERDIQHVKDSAGGSNGGQKGWFATNAEPSLTYPLRVDRIVPQGVTKESDNTFDVYAHADTNDPAWKPDMTRDALAWRPGMVGEARLDVDHECLAWIWGHRLVDFLRLKLWM